MYESRIAAGQLTVATSPGFAPEIDALAARNLSGHSFLRAAWYAAGGTSSGRTLLLRSPDASPLAAIPTVAFGPAFAGLRKVPGSYWPLRGVPIAPECSVFELAQALGDPAARRLGPVWRIGPVRADDPATGRLLAAAQLAGWSALARPAGTAWVIDCAAARREGWPRASTARRLRRLERRLAACGQVRWDIVRGTGWHEGVLEELASVEAGSWIAANTDGSGAKFMKPDQRAIWRSALGDPVLADMLCATILRVDGRAVAFSFDLDDGPVRYGIAGSYHRDYAAQEVGKLANYRALADAIADGRETVDLGAGNSGYKSNMGARAGYDLVDLLIVRGPGAARMLARAWGPLVKPDELSGGTLAGERRDD